MERQLCQNHAESGLRNVCILVCLVVCDSGQVSLEHPLLSGYPSQTITRCEVLVVCKTSGCLAFIEMWLCNAKGGIRVGSHPDTSFPEHIVCGRGSHVPL